MEHVYENDKIIGLIANGLLTSLDDIRDEYWAIESWDETENQIVWKHPNISKFFKGRGLSLSEVKPWIGKLGVDGSCGMCGQTGLTFGDCTSRTALSELMFRIWIQKTGRCHTCSQKQQAAAVLAKKLADKQAAQLAAQHAAEKALELQAYRESLELKHGLFFTDKLCPECEDGFLIARLNSTHMKPFLSCSRFNPHRYSCRYAQSLAPEYHEQYMKVFRARLLEKEEVTA